MKKSLIALAVAGAFAAPAFAATSNVDIYGVLNVALQSTDNGSDNDLTMVDNASRIGFKGTEDLGGGLKAIWQIESSINVGGAPEDMNANRNTFLGLSGGFGTVLFGRHDTPYKMSTGSMDPFSDTLGDYEDNFLNLTWGAGLNDQNDARVDNAIAYVSPNMSGFTFAAAVVTQANADEDTFDATSLSLNYANGPLTLAAAYQATKPLTTSALTGITEDHDSWKIGASYAFGDAKINAIYETNDIDNAVDVDSWYISGTYTMGPIVLKAAYGNSDVDFDGSSDEAESDQWSIGVDYNLSKRTSVYAVYVDGEYDASVSTFANRAFRNDMDNNGWQIGMKHSF